MKCFRCCHNLNTSKRCPIITTKYAPLCEQHLLSNYYLEVIFKNSYEGYGVFARLPNIEDKNSIVFYKDDEICYYLGEYKEVITNDEDNLNSARVIGKLMFSVYYKHNWIIDGSLLRSVGSMLNTTVKGEIANCKWVEGITKHRFPKIIANRNIYNFEECKIPYGGAYKLHMNRLDIHYAPFYGF
jgi:hypothetical protein